MWYESGVGASFVILDCSQDWDLEANLPSIEVPDKHVSILWLKSTISICMMN